MYENRPEIIPIYNNFNAARKEVQKYLVGQQQLLELLLAGLLANGHILIEGPPGIAKTLTAKLLAATLDIKFQRIQFTPDLMPADVLGTTVFNAHTQKFEFHQGPIFANLVLIDEINRAPAKTQSALFEVMEERQITADGMRYVMEPPFLVVATQNPIEHEGVYRLPEAQLDRFLFQITVNYPSLEEEIVILERFHNSSAQVVKYEINKTLSGKSLSEYQNIVRSVFIEPQLLSYIALLVHQTRNHSALYLGASPRASLAIAAGSKALAVLRGRDFVTPEDIKTVLLPVLRHRVQLTPEKEMQGVTVETVVNNLIEKVEIPR